MWGSLSRLRPLFRPLAAAGGLVTSFHGSPTVACAGDAPHGSDTVACARDAPRPYPTFSGLFATPSPCAASPAQTACRQAKCQKVLMGLRGWAMTKHKCCSKDCVSDVLRTCGNWPRIMKWHREWAKLTQKERHDALLNYVSENRVQPTRPPAVPDVLGVTGVLGSPGVLGVDRKARLNYNFMGFSMCQSAWYKLTGVSGSVLQGALTQQARGDVEWRHRGFERESVVQDTKKNKGKQQSCRMPCTVR